MGLTSTRICNPFATKKQLTVLMSGLDASGKTSIQCRLRFGEFPQMICSNASFIVEEIDLSSFVLLLVDLGASEKYRAIHVRRCTDVTALIYVIDISDEDRLVMARNELNEHLNEESMKGVNLLVFVNKRDLPSEISNEMIVDRLGLKEISDRNWHIQSTSAQTGEGLSEGMAWLQQSLQESIE